MNLVNNLSEGLDRIKCRFGHSNKKCKACIIKYKYCHCFLDYTNLKDDFNRIQLSLILRCK